MDSGEMRKYIQNFSLDNCEHGNQGYTRVLLQLFGLSGHGKSCFINSCKYVVDNAPYKVYAVVAPAEDKPQTMIRSSYELTGTIKLVDNRGCIKMNKNETGEIYAQLGNFLPLDTVVKWDTGYEDTLTKILEADQEDRSGDFIVPVFIYNSENRFSREDFPQIKEILLKAKQITGIFPTVVLTHETSELFQENQENFRRMGTQNIFALENYTTQDTVKIRKKHEKILKCLFEIVKDVEFRMEDERNPRKEKIERKKILHRFIIERERERVKEEEAIERAKGQEMATSSGGLFQRIRKFIT